MRPHERDAAMRELSALTRGGDRKRSFKRGNQTVMSRNRWLQSWHWMIAGALLAGGAARAADFLSWDDGCEKIGLSAGGSIFNGSCSPFDPKILTVATDMGGSFITYDAGIRWHTIHYKQLAGSISAAAAFHPKNPDVIYWDNRGSELKVSRDQGMTWNHVGQTQPWDREPITRIWLDPDYPERIFVGAADSTFYSSDEGQTWKTCDGVSGSLFRVVADRQSPKGARVYYAGTSSGVFRSDDGAATFVKKVSGLYGQTLAGFAGGSNSKETILYAAVPCEISNGKLAGGMYRSKNRGETWERCMNPKINMETARSSDYVRTDVPQYMSVACSDTQPERAYVFCDGTSFFPPNHTTIYRTDNAGEGWQSTFFSDPRFQKGDPRLKDPNGVCNVEADWETDAWGQREQGLVRGLEINPSNPDMVVFVQTRDIHYTLDAGKTWKSPYAGTCSVDKDGKKVWANSGEVVTSTWNYYIDPFDKLNRFIGYTDIGLARSMDGGKMWLPEMEYLKKVLPKGCDNTCYAMTFDPDVPGRVWAAFSSAHDIPNENALYRKPKKQRMGCIAVSDDHGATWKKLEMPVEGPVMSIVVDRKSPKDRRTLYASVFESGVVRSDDGGKTWELKNTGLDPEGPKRCLNLILHQDGTLFVATTAKEKKSKVGVGVYRTTDRGETWQNIADKQKWVWIRDFTVNPADSQTVLVPTSVIDPGLHRTTDGGKTWTTIYQNPNQYHFFGATYHPTHNGWIYLSCGESGDGAGYGLYLSKDDGKTWAPFTKIPFQAIQRITFDSNDPTSMYLTTFGSSVLKTPVEP